ncbi:hypothetical protein [Endozoicomonas atrinae]|uniref:hypothetical protein n=1 Tax=Endozoicomonas atrinae TaxID=1333660 RepID=UPI003B00F527
MDSYSINTPVDINPEHIKLPDPKPAKYSGIEAEKDTKILDSHGKLVSKWGRSIERFFDKAIIDPEKSSMKKDMHEFQKDMTERRVKVLMQEDMEGQEIPDHVDSILRLPDDIPLECTFVDRARFKKLVESDTEVYLSHEIKRCKSGASLVQLKKEVNRLEKDNKVSVTVIDSLNKKIHHQMAVLVREMPKHLKMIPYDGDPGKDFHMTRKKCEAVRNLLDAAGEIDESLVKTHRQAFRDMMVDVVPRDVKEIKNRCLARDNLRENKQLSTDIEELRVQMVEPFFPRVSSHPEKYCHKVKTNTEKALRALQEQREIIPNLVSKLNEEVERASEHIRVEAVYMLEKDRLEMEISKYEKKLEKAWKIQKPWFRHEIESRAKQISKCEKRAEKMRKEFEARQIGYIHTYGQLVPKLTQFKCVNAIYTGLPAGEDLHPHPEEVLAVDRGWELSAPLQALHRMEPMMQMGDSKEQFNYALGLESFNLSCFHSHFRNPPPEQADRLNEGQINDLQSQVQQLKSERSDQRQISGNSLAGIFDIHNQLVTAQIACELAWQNKGPITKDQLKRADELRFPKKEPLPDVVTGLDSNDQSRLTSDNRKPLPDLVKGSAPNGLSNDTSGSSSRTQTLQVDQPDENYEDEWDDDEWDDDVDYLTFNNIPASAETQQNFRDHIIIETQDRHPGYEEQISALGSRYLEWLNLDFGEQYISYNESLYVFKDVCSQLAEGSLTNTDINNIYLELDNAINKVMPPPPEQPAE